MPGNCRWRNPAPARCRRASRAAWPRSRSDPSAARGRRARWRRSSLHTPGRRVDQVIGTPLGRPGLAEILEEQAQALDLELDRAVAGKEQVELVRSVEADGKQREELARLGAVDVANTDRGDAVDAEPAVDPLVAARGIGEAGIDRPTLGLHIVARRRALPAEAVEQHDEA